MTENYYIPFVNFWIHLSNHSFWCSIYEETPKNLDRLDNPRHKQNQREATRNVKNNLEKKNNLKADNILP